MTELQEITNDDIQVTPRLKRWLLDAFADHLTPDMIADDEMGIATAKLFTRQAMQSGKLDAAKYEALTGSVLEDEKMSGKTATPEKVFKDAGSSRVDVKDESSKYSTKRFVAKHPKLGDVFNPVTKRPAELPSQLDDAKAGVLFKHLAHKSGLPVQLESHERELLTEMAEVDDWVGKMGGVEYSKIPGGANVKALLDDSTSGGLEVVPIAFDSNIVTFPLLTGELFPRVEVQDIPRGRRIEGASISTPTVQWGASDNTNLSLFDTSNLVAEINSTIFDVAVALEIGRDFLSDAATTVGQILQRLIGERMAEELDDVIAGGNGTSQPQGILSASGLSTVNTDNAAAGPPTTNDYISLMFSIGKQYRTAAMGVGFLSNDTTFQRSRSVTVGGSDQRPVFSTINEMNVYQTLGWPHMVQNDIGNRTCVFGAMRKYRLYRRAGMEIRFEDGGKELTRKNLVLLIARARFGGKIMDSNAFAKWTDGQS